MEGSVKLENLMIAANCNTTTNALDFNSKVKLIAYSAANSILILDPYHVQGSVPKVLFSLRGHTDRVNAVQWINDRTLVSVSSDKSWIVWAYEEGKDPRKPESWNYMRRYNEAHDLAINYLRTYSPTEGELYVLTMCVGGTLKLW